MAVILLIDDDINILRSFRFFLEKEGYQVFEAENGAIGLELFNQKNPDLVIVDLHMPVMDGFGVLKAVTRKSPDTSIIVVSGNDVIEDAVKAVQLGAWDYLLKPIYEFSVLIHAVEKGLERSRLIRENKSYQQTLEKEVIKRTRELESANQKLKAINEKLRSSEEKLQKSNLELERRVSERTAALERMNQELLGAKKASDAATEAKSSFLANMSHEIRTPMNGVIAATDLALEEELSPKVRNYLNIIRSSGRLLLGIINDILDLSKIEAGKLELENYSFDLEQVVENVVSRLVHKTLKKEITLIVDMDPAIPTRYKGDAIRLQQIMTNLLANAIKFTPDNGTIRLGISEDTKPSQDNYGALRVYVKDTGIGMSAAQCDKLFKPFSQADASTTRQFGGTGLGLSICKQLVQMMNGRIWAESAPGRGTTFYFTINLEYDLTQVVDKRHPAVSNLKTVVIASNTDRIDVISKYLVHFNHNVSVLDPGEQAIANVIDDYSTKKSIDLMVVDGDERDAEPIKLINFFQESLGIEIPVIVLTFPNSDIDKKLSEGSKLNTVLYKPVYPGSLLCAMKHLFRIDTSDPKDADAPVQQRPDTDIRPLNVLVVDDNLTNQQVAVAILEKAGIRATVAQTGKDAVDAVSAAEYDAVLMDIHMPKMDGYEATRAIRGELKKLDLPIIAMTANALKGDREKCLDAGMVGYITKPIDQKEMLNTLLEKTAANPVAHRFGTVERIDPDMEVDIPGISIREILANLSFDIDTVKEILGSFLNVNHNTMGAIKRAFDSGRLNDLWRMAHTLCGGSANIRAYDLQNAAKELEDRSADLRAGDNISGLDPMLIEKVETELNIVLQSISHYLGDGGSDDASDKYSR